MSSRIAILEEYARKRKRGKIIPLYPASVIDLKIYRKKRQELIFSMISSFYCDGITEIEEMIESL